MTVAPGKPVSRLLAYLQLFRAPNVFTAMADIAMGYLFVAGSLSPPGPFVLLLVASCLLYTAGMVLNDVYDFEIDTRERPQRPLPSGRISFNTALGLGYGMLAVGAAVGWAAGLLSGEADLPWRSGVVATLLAACILLYDSWAKKTIWGPIAMGGCRFLNVLLGMSVAAEVVSDEPIVLGYSGAQLIVAGGIGLYIVGVTWFARTEAKERSNSFQLLSATGVMIAGVALLASWPLAPSAPQLLLVEMHVGGVISPETVWIILLVLIAAPIFRRCLMAAVDPTPRNVQMAVKRCILSLILLDAAVALAAAGPVWGLLVLALLAPTLLLGAWVYST